MPDRCRRAATIALVGIAPIVAILAAGSIRAAGPTLLSPRPFAVGERLQYRIRLGPVTVGTATLEITGLRGLGGRTAYEFRYTARSNVVLAAIYPVRDRITSWADTLDFRSHRLRKQIREGPYRERGDWRLDHDSGQATAASGAGFAIPEGCHDVFSALLRLRASELTPRSLVEIPVILGGAVSSLQVEVGERRQVATPAGRFATIALTPRLGGQGPFRHEEAVTVDLGTDRRRLPVRIAVRVPVVGQLSVELVEFSR